MKNNYPFFFCILIGTLLIFQNNIYYTQCDNGVNFYPPSPHTPTTGAWTSAATNNWAGEVIIINVTAGDVYEFSTCVTYGGVSASYDTQLTLRQTDGTLLAYNDDYLGCGLVSYISWTSTITGEVYLHLNAYPCLSNFNSTEVRIYRTAGVLDFTWTGGGDITNWDDGGNWDQGTAPTSSDNCIIPWNVPQPDLALPGTYNCADLTINAKAVFQIRDGVTLNVAGNLSASGNVTTNGPSKLDITGTADFSVLTINVGSEIEVDGASTFTLGAPELFIIDGTFDANGDFNATGVTIDMESGSMLTLASTVTSLGILDELAGTVTYDGGTAMETDIYFNLVISSGNTHAAGGTITVNNDLTVSSGTFSVGSNTVTVSDASSTTDIDGTLTISTGTFDANGEFDATGGSVIFSGAGNLNLGSTVISLGIFTENTSTVTYDGGIQTVDSDTYYNLSLNGGLFTQYKTAAGNVTVSNDIEMVDNGSNYVTGAFTTTVTGSTKLNDGFLSISDNGTFDANGEFDGTSATFIVMEGSGSTLKMSTATPALNANVTSTTGTIEYDGTAQTVDNSPIYYDLAISGAGTKTAGGNLDINGDLNIAATTACRLDLLSYDINIVGDLTVGIVGGLDVADAGSVVTFDGGANQTITHEGSSTLSDNIDSYSASSLIAASSNNWESWSSSSGGGADDALISTSQAYSGSNSVYVSNSNGDDVVYALETAYTSGAFEASFNMYITHSAYFNVQKVSPWGTTWGIQLDFNNNLSISNSITGSYPALNTWFEVKLVADLDAGQWELFIDGVSQGAWTSVDGQGVAGINFYGNTGNSYYIDNIDYNGSTATYSAPTFKDVTINGAGITLADKMDVIGTLTLTTGDITTDATNKLTIKSGGTVSGGSVSSHVAGPMDYETASTTEITIPIGDGTRYRPVYIRPAAVTATTYTAKFTSSAYSDLTCTNAQGLLDHIAPGMYWDISNNGGSDADIGLSWDENIVVDVPADIRLAHWNGSAWEKVGESLTGSNGSGSAVASDGRVTGTNISDFSPFNLGSSGGGNPLPIDLLSFGVNCSHDIVDVDFTVISQVNNDYFLIERSENALEWEEVGTLEGAGNSNAQIDYNFVDGSPMEGLSYYRLTQVDYDGNFKTFSPVSISCVTVGSGMPIDVYPNPVVNEFIIELELDQHQGKDVYYNILDARGVIVQSNNIALNRGFNQHNIDVQNLSNGVYILRFINTKNHISETRIVKR